MAKLSATFNNRLRKLIICVAAILSMAASADEVDYELGGHIKGRLLADWFPGDSFFNQLSGSNAVDVESNFRLNFGANKGAWNFDAAWQVFAGYGDRIEFTRMIQDDAGFFGNGLVRDDRRLFDLTSVIEDDDKFAALHRLDRAWLGYTSERTVVRFGRQAISWGNGLIFSPMDIVNPFDPTAVDTEYKSGDDMLYGQYLRSNGDDVQAAFVFRRDVVTGDPESDQGTAAVKYHGIAGESEFDLLVAKHFDETTVGIGGNHGFGGMVWRGDLLVSDTDLGTNIQLVTNLSYSWVWHEKNMSGVIEYYFNEFGLSDDPYTLAEISQNADLFNRLARGEMSTVGRNYLAGGISIELTPLWILTPNIFANLDDGSALLQIVSSNNLSQNMEFLGALNVPFGPSGSEFGGVATDVVGVYLSTDLSLFAQISWYF